MPLIYNGLPFMFLRYKDKELKEPDKYVVIVAYHDYSFADTAWMDDVNVPKDKCLRPSVDILADGENTFEFDTEDEMIQFVSNWYQKHYPASN